MRSFESCWVNFLRTALVPVKSFLYSCDRPSNQRPHVIHFGKGEADTCPGIATVAFQVFNGEAIT